MKNILLSVSIMLFGSINAQNTDYVKTEQQSTKKSWTEYIHLTDVVKGDKPDKFNKYWFKIKDKKVKMQNGKKQEIDVNLSVGFQDYEPNQKDIDIINMDMETVLFTTKLKLKNKFSFEPYDVSVYRSETGYKIFIKYTAKNDYGIEKDGINSFEFDLTGKFIK